MNTSHTPRVNPRRPIHWSAAGIARIVLGEIASIDGAVQTITASHDVAVKPLRSTAAFSRSVLVATVAERGHITDHAREVIAAAALLADAQTEVVLAVLGEHSDDLADYAVDRVLNCTTFDSQAWQTAAMTEWLAACVAQVNAQHIYMADNQIDGDWARRYAAQFAVPCTAHVVALTSDTARIRADAQHDVLCAPTTLMILDRSVANTDLPFVGRNALDDAPPFNVATINGVLDHGIKVGDAQTVALEEADFIISAGKGMQDLALFNELASALGAATGASRVAVDDGMFARARQVGATGKTVHASTYIALGISGAVQHLQGIKDCRHVIAVNLDAAAPIARRADLMVVADTGEWMRALLAEIRSAKGNL